MPWGDRLRLILNALYRRASSPCQISLPLFLSLSPPLFPTPSSPSVLYIPLLLFLLTITHPSSTLPLYFIHYILCIFFQSLSWFHFELHSRSLLPTSLMMKTFFFFFFTLQLQQMPWHTIHIPHQIGRLQKVWRQIVCCFWCDWWSPEWCGLLKHIYGVVASTVWTIAFYFPGCYCPQLQPIKILDSICNLWSTFLHFFYYSV